SLIKKEKEYFLILFQFLMVRLKVRVANDSEVVNNIFQFLMVRLKAVAIAF
ncbi:MAG TPA: hypothetical protein GX402_01720, partial [Bacteroidales bacterium]|nr:hypothetical protein [Bacteroidales bacterium]